MYIFETYNLDIHLFFIRSRMKTLRKCFEVRGQKKKLITSCVQVFHEICSSSHENGSPPTNYLHESLLTMKLNFMRVVSNFHEKNCAPLTISLFSCSEISEQHPYFHENLRIFMGVRSTPSRNFAPHS
jgi:hypothetical protein